MWVVDATASVAFPVSYHLLPPLPPVLTLLGPSDGTHHLDSASCRQMWEVLGAVEGQEVMASKQSAKLRRLGELRVQSARGPVCHRDHAALFILLQGSAC